MFDLFCPLEERVGPSILTVGIVCFVFFLSSMLKFCLEFISLLFVRRDVSTVIRILEYVRIGTAIALQKFTEGVKEAKTFFSNLIPCASFNNSFAHHPLRTSEM
jgi:hypothetical protein